MVTIVDVARVAGVSKSTVSRVLDERLPRSQNATAERVRKAAAELGYVRDPLASGLRRVGTSTIGVVVPHLTDTVMAMLYEEIAAAATTRGLFAVVASTNDDPDTERVAVRVTGAPPRRRAHPHHRPHRHPDPTRTGRPSLPHVLALRTNDTSPASVGDDRLGAHLATRHLLDLGHRRIGLVSGPAYASTARNREAGYRDALTEAGVPVDETLIAGDSFTMQAGELAGRTLLDRPDRPTAIFAVNDNNAIGVMAAAHALRPERPRRPVPRRLQRHPRRQPAPGTADHRPRALPTDRRERPGTPPRSRQRRPTPHPRRRADTHPTQVSRRLRTLSCLSGRLPHWCF